MYRFALWLLAGLLLLALFACAAGSDGNGAGRGGDSGSVSSVDVPSVAGPARKLDPPMRLLLAASEARDSAAVVTDFFVDQALRQALDSIPSARYLTLNYRDSLATLFVQEGKTGIPLPELGKRLDLDAAIYTRIARFGSILACELRLVDPATGNLLFRDLTFSLIRYRDTAGTMYLGPTLYDLVRKSVGRYFGMPHTAEQPVATEPLIVSGVVIPADKALGQLFTRRQSISTNGVKSIAEFGRLHFPELVAFDYASRNEVYRTGINVAAVDDYIAMDPLERQALYNIGIDRYVSARTWLDADSLRLSLELRYITSRAADSLIDHQDTAFARTRFETSTAEDDFIIALIDLAEPLFNREAERARAAYSGYRRTLGSSAAK